MSLYVHKLENRPWIILKITISEKGADRLSDESSKKADSDSHPENWTDHEHSDPQQPTASSPPKSAEEKNKVFNQLSSYLEVKLDLNQTLKIILTCIIKVAVDLLEN